MSAEARLPDGAAAVRHGACDRGSGAALLGAGVVVKSGVTSDTPISASYSSFRLRNLVPRNMELRNRLRETKKLTVVQIEEGIPFVRN